MLFKIENQRFFYSHIKEEKNTCDHYNKNCEKFISIQYFESIYYQLTKLFDLSDKFQYVIFPDFQKTH